MASGEGGAVSYTTLFKLRSRFATQGRKAEMARAAIKMKPGARILRTIA